MSEMGLMKISNDRSQLYLNSNFYEQLTQHVFISELLQEAWFCFGQIIEVLHSEIDTNGYDLVMECNGITRHIQLKTIDESSKTSNFNVNISLSNKPSGCVILLVRKEDSDSRIKLTYRAFGNQPGQPVKNLDDFKTGKHTKGDATGAKKERPNIRQVPKSRFIDISSSKQLLLFLFGLK